MKSERLGRAVEQIQDFSANTRYRINLKKREFNVRAKENMLLESDINYPGDFDEYVKELFNSFVNEMSVLFLKQCRDEFYHTSTIYWNFSSYVYNLTIVVYCLFFFLFNFVLCCTDLIKHIMANKILKD